MKNKTYWNAKEKKCKALDYGISNKNKNKSLFIKYKFTYSRKIKKSNKQGDEVFKNKM